MTGNVKAWHDDAMAMSGEQVSKMVVQLLSQVRRERSMTMEELADRAGVHRTYIGLLERSERQPTLATAIDIAAAMGVRLPDLLQTVFAEGNIAAPTVVTPPPVAVVPQSSRKAERSALRDASNLEARTSLTAESIARAIDSAYQTLDLLDEQLLSKNAPPVAQLVELANLSSIVGNLVGAGLAEHSQGRYTRNRPHAYPDLLATVSTVENIEVKTALETNRPKGHLAKAGHYLTFRYVLGGTNGSFLRGKANRGNTVFMWEVRFGYLSESDFSESNTPGDSGKTAVVKLTAFTSMETIYLDDARNPYSRNKGT